MFSSAKQRRTRIRRSFHFISFNWRADRLIRTLPVRMRDCLQPGDIIATLRRVGEADAGRILLVHRFMLRRGEHGRHLLCIPGNVSNSHLPRGDQPALDISNVIAPINTRGDRIVYVDSVHLKEKHSGERESTKARPVPLLGTLGNGEKYVIYRCSLFVDAFNTSSMYVSAKYEGVYIQPLTVSADCKVDSASARVISLVPPGVDLAPVIRRFVKDFTDTLRRAMYVYDANGEKRRVIVDVVNIVGDTLGLNAFLDMKGHNALAFCHRCNFNRITKAEHLGNTCMSDGITWGNTMGRRTADRQRAIRASSPPLDVFEYLGMDEVLTDVHAVLYHWQDELRRCRAVIPQLSDGRRLVSSEFDPFIGSSIGIDHLLGGMGKDLLRGLLKCISSPNLRAKFGAVVINLAREKVLFNIGQIISKKKKELSTMSLSTLYIIIPFVSKAFALILKEIPSDVASPVRLEMAELWELFTNLVGSIWDKGRDHQLDKFKYRNSMRVAFNNFWVCLRKVCNVSEEMENACSIPSEGVIEVKKMAQPYRLCHECLKLMEKPNTHRLQEYFVEQKYCWNHGVWMGELSLERVHQKLKAALKRSNKKEEQLLAMNSIRFWDWQGRLTALLNSEEIHLRESFALLIGRNFLDGPVHPTVPVIQAITRNCKMTIPEEETRRRTYNSSRDDVYSVHTITSNSIFHTAVHDCIKMGCELIGNGEIAHNNNEEEDSFIILDKLSSFPPRRG